MPFTVQDAFPEGTIRNACFLCLSDQRVKKGKKEPANAKSICQSLWRCSKVYM
jgi:hypothetical protein